MRIKNNFDIRSSVDIDENVREKQVSQLTFFNYVTEITVGSIAANIVSESNEPFMDDFI